MNNKNFTYKEKDLEGEETLNVIAKADKFNYWMYKTIKKYSLGEILEIGSGIGNISYFFLEDNFKISLSDIRENYCQNLQNKFSKYNNLGTIYNLDITDEKFDEKYQNIFGSFDTIFSLNVIEHIEDDSLAFRNLNKLLKPNGRLITLVPAYRSLYCNFDKELQHFRRYSRKGLKAVVEKNGFITKNSFYFNFIGIFGWYFSGKILKKKTIPEGQMNFYNFFVPVFKLIDIILFKSMGLSTINISQKVTV